MPQALDCYIAAAQGGSGQQWQDGGRAAGNQAGNPPVMKVLTPPVPALEGVLSSAGKARMGSDPIGVELL